MNIDMYQNWNFKENPFATTPLTSDDEGNELIAGRDKDINKFLLRLYNMPQIVTLEGDNGIGKTSIINVGIFRSILKYKTEKHKSSHLENPLFFPCKETFQLQSHTDIDTFTYNVFVQIAQTIINNKEALKELCIKIPKDINDLDKWLNHPQSHTFQGSIGFSLAQISAGKTTETNTSSGFETNGLITIVRRWLIEMFENNKGGIVCVIDNLELLEKSNHARKVLETLRDTLLTTPGIRWILCGSLNIVSSVLSSPRLEGYLHDPIQVVGITSKYLEDAFLKRQNKFKASENYYLPITISSFDYLYEILKGNIRNTLKFANDYCIWVADNYEKTISNEEKENAFLEWLTDKSTKFKTDIEKKIKPVSLNLFLTIVKYGGNFSFSDYRTFDFKNATIFRESINELEKNGIVVFVIDDNDNKRKSIQITPKGYFVSHAFKTI